MRAKRYILGFGIVKQRPLNAGAFEQVLIVFDGIGMNNLLEAWVKISEQLSGKANETVALDVGGAIDEAMTALAAVGTTGALSAFLSAVLDIPVDHAKQVPMTVARSVLADFFMLNKNWLPITLKSSSQKQLRNLMSK